MSISIGLTVRRQPDVEFLHHGIVHFRLLCRVQFDTPARTTFVRQAIIDTGAPLCLIPADVWEQVRTQSFETTHVGGLVSRRECAVPARLGILAMTLLDPRGHRHRLTVRAFLAQTTDVPLILGFQDCLEKAILHVDAPHRQARLDFA